MDDRVTDNGARIFGSGDFVMIPPWVLQQKYQISIVPCQLWESVTGAKILIGACPRSQRGDDYGVNKTMLDFMQNAYEKGKAKQCLVKFVTIDPKTRAITTVDGQITLE